MPMPGGFGGSSAFTNQSSMPSVQSRSTFSNPFNLFGYGIQEENQAMELQLMQYQNELNQSNARDANLMAQQNADIAHERNIELMQMQQAFNAEEARKVRDWNATSYQRTMRDMKEAGLNPILAYSQGAAITGGQAASSGLSSASQASTYLASPAANPDMDYTSNRELSKARLQAIVTLTNNAITNANQTQRAEMNMVNSIARAAAKA